MVVDVLPDIIEVIVLPTCWDAWESTIRESLYIPYPTMHNILPSTPALMHFCELHALLILPMSELGSTVPRKMGLNCEWQRWKCERR